jgi:hypothetical protein
MHASLISLVLTLQIFFVLFLSLHDWVPLGPLNDVRAAQAADTRRRLILVTVASAVPSIVGLVGSLIYFRRAFPTWLTVWLWVTYVGLLLGQIRAWWIPYLFVPEPVRAARYRSMFEHTHAFLPSRNGIRPNTLHMILGGAILSMLAVLTALAFER